MAPRDCPSSMKERTAVRAADTSLPLSFLETVIGRLVDPQTLPLAPAMNLMDHRTNSMGHTEEALNCN